MYISYSHCSFGTATPFTSRSYIWTAYCIGLGAIEQQETNVYGVICKYQRHVKAIQKQNSAFSQEGNVWTGPQAVQMLQAVFLQLAGPITHSIQHDQRVLVRVVKSTAEKEDRIFRPFPKCHGSVVSCFSAKINKGSEEFLRTQM